MPGHVPASGGGPPSVDYRATCVRPRWEELPAGVRQAVADAAGSPVVAADDPPGSGFTGGFAAVVRLRDGRRVFAKAGSSRNPHLVAAYRQEARVLATLPVGVPAPRLVGSAGVEPGDVDEHAWQVVVAEAVDGSIPQPWTEAAVESVHEACGVSAGLLAAPLPGLELSSTADALAGSPAVAGCYAAIADGSLPLTAGQPGWVRAHLDDLTALTARAGHALAGDVAVHGDLRADNVLVDGAGRAVVVDWNWMSRGPAWTDFVGVLPPARADGVDVDTWMRRSGLTAEVDPDDVDTLLALVAAYMLASADTPVWPGGPAAVRVHQRRFAWTFLDWLGARRGWDGRRPVRSTPN